MEFASSVTRFGEISSLWKNVKSWVIFKPISVFGKFLNLFWQMSHALRQICIAVNDKI